MKTAELHLAHERSQAISQHGQRQADHLDVSAQSDAGPVPLRRRALLRDVRGGDEQLALR